MYRRSFPMICTKLRCVLHEHRRKTRPSDHAENLFYYVRQIHSARRLLEKDNTYKRQLIKAEDFENIKDKSKETYLEMVHIYENSSVQRRGHVEFIYSAMKHMKEFGVHKDLEVYKALINVLPKGKFIPTNIFQAEFMHYPKQQQCIIDVLEQMEDNGVMPDAELETILINIFGRRGHPVRKYWRMMYWMPKFKNLSPWPLPNPVPNDNLELAKLAMKRISSVDLQSKVVVYQTAELADSVDDTWVVSVQSPDQRKLVDTHPENIPVYVKGAYRVWLRDAAVNYFILMRKPVQKPQVAAEDPDDVSNLRDPVIDTSGDRITAVVQAPSVHEQDDGTILAMCATGTSSRDSLLSWIRLLEADGNPQLAKIPVVFTLKSPPGDKLFLEEGIISEEQKTIPPSK
ncbi:evolutionarily conserved signaling intermediate in Toll pathway, mitochondrial [Schistocerca americana]|uniref:evolutionarily conserved signaling intermediate in Toll pathway, mitochondrial n=1 Tax=Schistocerca americana TaxID=7009 RepID=UPI001F50365F|nr:evolutionarily conserved signaling intermediate in Toll pathway, mitochondrial [Schistocerca americana]XP_047114513.1 evolutionarily conserved signaling intermediate in Toll pathway, mitochondrial [Schistocerca piceifrons]XP_049960243.1 evolutionarily conserved signaling intermediate in Toll pathway, mitochondrial isoform X1 [Schistocerca serialis cubense]